jgi:hypothetical protein
MRKLPEIATGDSTIARRAAHSAHGATPAVNLCRRAHHRRSFVGYRLEFVAWFDNLGACRGSPSSTPEHQPESLGRQPDASLVVRLDAGHALCSEFVALY